MTLPVFKIERKHPKPDNDLSHTNSQPFPISFCVSMIENLKTENQKRPPQATGLFFRHSFQALANALSPSSSEFGLDFAYLSRPNAPRPPQEKIFCQPGSSSGAMVWIAHLRVAPYRERKKDMTRKTFVVWILSIGMVSLGFAEGSGSKTEEPSSKIGKSFQKIEESVQKTGESIQESGGIHSKIRFRSQNGNSTRSRRLYGAENRLRTYQLCVGASVRRRFQGYQRRYRC